MDHWIWIAVGAVATGIGLVWRGWHGKARFSRSRPPLPPSSKTPPVASAEQIDQWLGPIEQGPNAETRILPNRQKDDRQQRNP